MIDITVNGSVYGQAGKGVAENIGNFFNCNIEIGDKGKLFIYSFDLQRIGAGNILAEYYVGTYVTLIIGLGRIARVYLILFEGKLFNVITVAVRQHYDKAFVV